MKTSQFLTLALALALPLAAQMKGPDPKENPVAATSAQLYMQVAGNITKSIEKMPADKFSYKPIDTVMPFSEFIGHLVDANMNFCTAITGGTRPASIRKEADKEKLAAAWKNAMDECTKAWSMTTDKSMGEMKTMGKMERPAAFPLLLNTSHTWEHYGNLVTYMRMNGLVPPSSDRR